MKAKIKTEQVKIVVKNWSGEEHEAQAPLVFNTFIGKMTVPFKALNVPEGGDFPAQMDVYDAAGDFARFSIMHVYPDGDHPWGEYRSAASTLMVTK